MDTLFSQYLREKLGAAAERAVALRALQAPHVPVLTQGEDAHPRDGLSAVRAPGADMFLVAQVAVRLGGGAVGGVAVLACTLVNHDVGVVILPLLHDL